MKKENLKQVYGTPSKEFHERVVQTLDSLEERKIVHYSGSARKKIVAIGIAAAVLGTFTITAAATNFFGLTATRKGTYGLNVKVESGVSDEESKISSMMLNFGYMPDKYSSGKMFGNYEFKYYVNENEYFHAIMMKSKDFEADLGNVIDTAEDVIDGHKTIFVTCREAENTDDLRYSSFKYFDEEGYLIHCIGSDCEELMKITEKVNLKPATKISYDEDHDDSDLTKHGAVKTYMEDRLKFMLDFFNNEVEKVNIGESVELSVADHEQEAVKLTAKITSVEKRDNADGLTYDDFVWFNENVYDTYFNYDGTLIKEESGKIYIEGDEEHLSKWEYFTHQRNFYVANIEVTADDVIDNLYDVFGTEVYLIDEENNCFFTSGHDDDGADLQMIYLTDADKQVKLEKGEIATIQVGFIAEDNTADNAYLGIVAADGSNELYHKYTLKIKE